VKFLNDGGETIAPGASKDRRISQTRGTTKIAAIMLPPTRYKSVPVSDLDRLEGVTLRGRSGIFFASQEMELHERYEADDGD
jgi:hypothetical protein